MFCKHNCFSAQQVSGGGFRYRCRDCGHVWHSRWGRYHPWLWLLVALMVAASVGAWESRPGLTGCWQKSTGVTEEVCP